MEDILQEAIETYGEFAQTDVAIEKLSELIKAIIKDRKYCSYQTKTDIIEEVADVEIMCKQLRLIYDKDAVSRVDKVIKRKLKRLAQRIEKTKKGEA